MRIDSVGVKVPSRKVTNADILQLLEKHSNGVSPILLKTYQRMVRDVLHTRGPVYATSYRSFQLHSATSTFASSRPSARSSTPIRSSRGGSRLICSRVASPPIAAAPG